jgi:hypothetical protein
LLDDDFGEKETIFQIDEGVFSKIYNPQNFIYEQENGDIFRFKSDYTSQKQKQIIEVTESVFIDFDFIFD